MDPHAPLWLACSQRETIGELVNPQIAVGSTLSCFEDEQEAYDKLVDGANFFTCALAWHYVHGRQKPGETSIWELFEAEAYGADKGVGVSCLCPGYVNTNLGRTSRMTFEDPEAWIRSRQST